MVELSAVSHTGGVNWKHVMGECRTVASGELIIVTPDGRKRYIVSAWPALDIIMRICTAADCSAYARRTYLGGSSEFNSHIILDVDPATVKALAFEGVGSFVCYNVYEVVEQ